MWDYIVARIQEPSTWVSLGSLFTGLGIAIAPDKWQAITTIGLGLGGLIGAALKDRRTTIPEIKEVVKDTVVPSVIQKGE